MKIAIASKSPVKRRSVELAFEQLWPDARCDFVCVDAPSGVSDQPASDEETRAGALGRLAHAKTAAPGADIYIALEGGVGEHFGDLHCFGWVVAESNGKTGYGRTFSFVIPPGVRKHIDEDGLELSHAVDAFFAQTGTKQGTGLIGPLTRDRVTYTDWYVHAVISALLPIFNPELY